MRIHFSRLEGRGRRVVGAAIAGSTLLAGAGGIGLAAVGAAPAGAAGTPASSSSSCPMPTGAGQIGFSGALSNLNVKIGGSNSISGISGSLCGTFDTTNLSYTIPASSVSLSKGNDMFWGFLPFPTTMSVANDISGSLTTAGPGTYTTTVNMKINDVTNILWGFPCNIGPISVSASTGSSGLQGSFVTQLAGNLSASGFSVPAIQASSSCPSFIAGLGNLLSGFPTKSTSASFSMTLTPLFPSTSSSS